MASCMKAVELRDLLKDAGVKIAVKSKRDDLWRLCLEHNLVEREFVNQTDITVVKSSLQYAMNLNNKDFKLFSDRIEKYVSIISRLLRRSSLIFYYHILRLEELKASIPNYYKMKDTYWKKWLKIGLQTDFPDHDSKETYTKVSEHFKEDILVSEIDGIKYFDQILAYAATTFQTSIENNAWYPLFSKLNRLTKLKLNEWEEKDVKQYHVLQEIRSPFNDLNMSQPPKVAAFIKEVRELLCIDKNTDQIKDTHGREEMTFHQAFKFNMWMQKHFETLEVRMTRLSPVFSVNRAHIRLDVKTLTFLFKDLFQENVNVQRYRNFCASNSILEDPLKPATLQHKDCSDEVWNQYQESLIVYEEALKEFKSMAPHKLMLCKVIAPTVIKKSKCSVEAWLEYKQALQIYKAEVRIVKSSVKYINLELAHKKHAEEQTRMIASFFTKLRKKDWTFDCSIQTDGVSLSRQFSRERIVERKPSPKVKEITIVEDYNKRLSCFIEATNTLVIGLDPGRVNLACLSYIWIKDNGEIEKKSWSLTRAQYYNDSGITLRSNRKARRFENLAESWSHLGTLRASKSVDIINYVKQYNLIKEDWWKKAMKQNESRDTLRAYSGKKKVLNHFFAKIKKKVREMHPDVKAIVAYGSAVQGMCSTGLGEVSAPVGETYKTCCRHFETQIQNEAFSTKRSFEKGCDMEKVFKRFKFVEGTIYESFGHCDKNINVQASSQEEKDLLDAYNMNRKKKKKRWKKDEEEIEISPKQLKGIEKRRFHFPVIRGLQFCPETCMYVDRDMKASLTIARLAVMRIVGNERPRAFVRENKKSKAGDDAASTSMMIDGHSSEA